MAESTQRFQLALMPPATRSTAARRDDGDSGAAAGLQRAQQEADKPVDSRHHQGAQPSPSSSISSGPPYSPLFDVEPPGQGGHQSGVSTPMSSPPPRDDFHQVLVQWLAAQAAPRQVYLTYLDVLHWTEEYILVALNCVLWLGLLGGIIVYFGWPWKYPHTDWVVDITSDLHITNDASLICRQPRCFGQRSIMINHPANSTTTNENNNAEAPRSSFFSFLNKSPRPQSALHHNGLSVHGLGHVHLAICDDHLFRKADLLGQYLCKDWITVYISPILYVPSAPVNRLSLPLLAAEAAISGDKIRTLQFQTWLDNREGRGETVLSGVISR